MTSCLIPRLLVVFTRQLEILVTTLPFNTVSNGPKKCGCNKWGDLINKGFFKRKCAWSFLPGDPKKGGRRAGFRCTREFGCVMSKGLSILYNHIWNVSFDFPRRPRRGRSGHSSNCFTQTKRWRAMKCSVSSWMEGHCVTDLGYVFPPRWMWHLQFRQWHWRLLPTLLT